MVLLWEVQIQLFYLVNKYSLNTYHVLGETEPDPVGPSQMQVSLSRLLNFSLLGLL